MIAVLSAGIFKIPALDEMLEGEVRYVPRFRRPCAVYSAVVGWGKRPTAEKARRFAQANKIPIYLSLEDGFLRSVGLGGVDAPSSIVVDDLGIYYDATTPSRLEILVGRTRVAGEIERTNRLIGLWKANRLSKYNHLPEREAYAGGVPPRQYREMREPYVLVADQTYGDVSICHGLADTQTFQRMLEAALLENPESRVVVKVHPAVLAGKKKGHFDIGELARNCRITILAEELHPVSLIEHAEAVYTVTSQIGFEGLLWGKRVRTFGMPFYAGWGLTEDELPAPDRRCKTSLENLVHAALVEYPRYIDPETKRRCEPERLIEWMGLQREQRERFPPVIHAIDFSRWKKPIVRDFFQGSSVRFIQRADEVPAGGTLACWGRKPFAGQPGEDVRILRIEDGFLRSVGLGAELVRPVSWVIDDEGIYYDASRPSRLERMLESGAFAPALTARASSLRNAIISEGVTKYNVGAGTWKRPDAGQTVILVPGQVETDASIHFGAIGIKRNIDLLKAVRAANPDAYIVYKPHPDVRAALRKAGNGESDATQWSDEVVADVPFAEMLSQVDEVHVLTSLAGFEALMRGKRVVCYGQPFYSGWGLTEDVTANSRRTRKLTVDELVAGALILYPTYISRVTGRYTTPERTLEELIAWRQEAPKRRSLLRRAVARLLRKD